MNLPGVTNQPAAAIAHRFAMSVAQLLTDIRGELQRLRELQEGADRYNYLGAGTVQYGNNLLGTNPVTIIEANPKRGGLSVQNVGTAGNISVGIGNRSPQINTGITLTPGGSWDGRLSGRLVQASITLVGSQAACAFSLVEAVE